MLRNIFIIILINIGITMAQTGALTGTIIDRQTEQPLVGANISIENTSLGAATDNEGRYFIANLPVGSYNISVEYISYDTILKNNVIVSSGKTAVLNFKMIESAIEGAAVIVVANYFTAPKESAVSSESIDFEEVRRSPGSNMDIQRVVQALPSVVSGADQMNEIITRGGNPGENLFLMDQIEIPNPNHFGMQGAGGGPINAINTLMVENVDFYAGAFSARYGDRASSVMNISLREGSRDAFYANIDMSLAGFGGIVEGPLSGGSGSYLFSARKSYLDLIISNTGLTAIPYYYSLQGKTVHDLNNSNRLIFNIFYGDDHINIEDQRGERSTRHGQNIRSAGKQFAFGGSLRTLWSKKMVSLTTLSAVGNIWNDEIYRTDNGNNYMTNYSDEREYQLKSDINWKPQKNIWVDFGASVKVPKFDHDRWIDFDTVFVYDVAGGNPDLITGVHRITPEQIQIQEARSIKTFGYVQTGVALSEKTEVSLGLRYDYFEYNNFHAFSPRFSISRRLTSQTKLNLAAGRHFQSPQYVLLTRTAANSDLKSYFSDQAVIGIEHFVGNDARATAELYYKKYTNVPVDYQRVTGDPFGYYDGLHISEGESYSYGAELFFQKKLTKNWSSIISYSFSHSQTRDLRDNSWFASDFDYRHVLNFLAGYKYPMNHLSWYKNMKKKTWYKVLAFFMPFADEVEWSARYRYMGGRPYTEREYIAERKEWIVPVGAAYNNVRYSEYHRLDLHLDRRFFFGSWTLVTYIDIANITNRDNLWGYQYNTDGSTEEILQYKTFPIIGVTFEF